jgi:hypothetical protein
MVNENGSAQGRSLGWVSIKDVETSPNAFPTKAAAVAQAKIRLDGMIDQAESAIATMRKIKKGLG